MLIGNLIFLGFCYLYYVVEWCDAFFGIFPFCGCTTISENNLVACIVVLFTCVYTCFYTFQNWLMLPFCNFGAALPLIRILRWLWQVFSTPLKDDFTVCQPIFLNFCFGYSNPIIGTFNSYPISFVCCGMWFLQLISETRSGYYIF